MVKSTDPTGAQFDAYRAMWSYFNAVMFGGTLREVILNFSRRAKSLGFFAPDRWESAGQVTHEISLNPTHLRRDSARDVASTLVHEMVHLWQWQREHGAPKRPGYHDAQWGRKMEELGLMPSATGAPGGKRTGYKMSHYIVEGAAFARAFDAMPAEYLLPWTCGIDEDAIGKKKAKRKESKLKYTCPQCAMNMWGRPELRVRCEDCNVLLVSDEVGEVGNTEAELRAA